MIHFDESFIILLGFLTFIGLCWYYLATPLKRFLDDWIKTIRQEIKEAEDALHEAHAQYQAVKQRSEAIHNEIQLLHERAQTDLQKYQVENAESFNQILVMKDKTYEARVAALHRTKLIALETEVLSEILTFFQERLRVAPDIHKTSYLDAVLDKIARVSSKS